MGTLSLLGSMSYNGVWARWPRWIQPPWVSKAKWWHLGFLLVLSSELMSPAQQCQEVRSPQSLADAAIIATEICLPNTGRKPRSAPGKSSLSHAASTLRCEEETSGISHFTWDQRMALWLTNSFLLGSSLALVPKRGCKLE